MDEWLRKWNRTCPLCKATIERRRGGGGGGEGPSVAEGTATSDHEEAHLLSNEEGEEGEGEGYGATGSSNPLASSEGGLSDSGSVHERQRNRSDRRLSQTRDEQDSGSTLATIELSPPPGATRIHGDSPTHSSSGSNNVTVTFEEGEGKDERATVDRAVVV